MKKIDIDIGDLLDAIAELAEQKLGSDFEEYNLHWAFKNVGDLQGMASTDLAVTVEIDPHKKEGGG